MRLALYTEAVGSGMGRFTRELHQALQLQATTTLIAPRQPWESVSAPSRAPERWILSSSAPRQRIAKILAMLRTSLEGAGAVSALHRQAPVVFNHLGTMPWAAIALLAAKARGLKAALILHDFYPHDPRFPSLLQGAERWMYRACYRTCDTIFTLTDIQRVRLLQIGVRADAIVPVRHGAWPISDIRRPPSRALRRVLVFGALRPNKRVLESIAAVQELRRQGHPIALRIAGMPAREAGDYWARCLSLLETAPDGIEVLDRFIQDEELGEIYSDVDALLCPYAEFESQSGVVMSALCNAIPLVATATAHPQIRAQGIAVSEPVTPVTIAAALLALLDAPVEGLAARSAAASAAIAAEVGWDRLASTIRRAVTG